MSWTPQRMNAAFWFVFFFLLTAYSGYALVDRLIWADGMVGKLNSKIVMAADGSIAPACSKVALIEVAPGSESDSMRYRCGAVFWPLYSSGESADLLHVWRGLGGE